MNFKDNLKKYRESAGITSAKDFATALGIPYQTYLNYENKGTEPKYEVLCRIAAALGVTTDELLGYKLDEYIHYKNIVQSVGFVVGDDDTPITVWFPPEEVNTWMYTEFETKDEFIKFASAAYKNYEKSGSKADLLRKEISTIFLCKISFDEFKDKFRAKFEELPEKQKKKMLYTMDLLGINPAHPTEKGNS